MIEFLSNPSNWWLMGNLVLAFATLLLIRTVMKNTKMLMGYDLVGAALTFVGLLFMLVGFFYASQYLSMVFVLVTVVYWGLVVLYKVINRNKSKSTITGDTVIGGPTL
jgi:hypothetical protein